MAWAQCTNKDCKKIYRWRAKRGTKLKDFKCRICRAELKAYSINSPGNIEEWREQQAILKDGWSLN